MLRGEPWAGVARRAARNRDVETTGRDCKKMYNSVFIRLGVSEIDLILYNKFDFRELLCYVA